MEAAEAIISRIERAAKTEKNGGRLQLEWPLLLTVYIYIFTLELHAVRRSRWKHKWNGNEGSGGVEESAINFAEFTI